MNDCNRIIGTDMLVGLNSAVTFAIDILIRVTAKLRSRMARTPAAQSRRGYQ